MLIDAEHRWLVLARTLGLPRIGVPRLAGELPALGIERGHRELPAVFRRIAHRLLKPLRQPLAQRLLYHGRLTVVAQELVVVPVEDPVPILRLDEDVVQTVGADIRAREELAREGGGFDLEVLAVLLAPIARGLALHAIELHERPRVGIAGGEKRGAGRKEEHADGKNERERGTRRRQGDAPAVVLRGPTGGIIPAGG